MINPNKFIPALGYNFLTEYYDLAIKVTMPEQKIRHLLLEMLNPQPTEKILEFGFGTGSNLVLALKKCPYAHLSGLDIDQKIQKIARQKLAKHGFTLPLDLYDGSIFPYSNQMFDKIYSCLVFHQIEDNLKIDCLSEIFRVLKSGGQLIIADWGVPSHIGMRLAFGLVQLLDGFKTTNANKQGRIPYFIQKVGFREVTLKHSINTPIGTFSYFSAIKN